MFEVSMLNGIVDGYESEMNISYIDFEMVFLEEPKIKER